MKQLTFLFVALMLSPFSNAQKLEIKHLTGNCYIYTTYQNYGGEPYPANGLYLITDEGAVIIDSPWDKTQCQPLLDSIQKRHGKKVVLCIATHFHADRTGSFDAMRTKGIKTYTSEQTAKLCKKHKENLPEFTFKKDTVFTIGGYKIQTFYPGKGHTPDNIVVWFDKDKVLYGGCFVKSTESPDLGNLSDADVKAWPQSIQNTLTQFPDAQFVIPGHQSWESNQGLQHTLGMLRKKNAQKK